jgi:hypothetical protein
MNAIAYRNGVLLFTALYAGFWAYVFWTGTPKLFNLVFGKDRSPLEASGYRYAACSNIAIVLLCLVSVWGLDFEKRRALRIMTPVWVADLLIILADKPLYNILWWNIITASFVVGIVLSYIGGFVLSNEKVAIHVHKHVAPDPTVLVEESKTHQA